MRTSISEPEPKRLRRFIEEEARRAGFDSVGIASATVSPEAAGQLRRFLKNGYHGTMAWLQETVERRSAPNAMWPEARSVVMLGMNYGPDDDPLAALQRRDCASISVYARHRDYHDVVKGRLKTVAGRLASRTGEEVKVFVDTAPLMEKPLAAAAGLGWQGRHTNLVSRAYGSWLFLGAILTSIELEADVPESDHCGSCRA